MPAHGVLITSATLTDGSGDLEADWAAAEARTGAHASAEAGDARRRCTSPFDYPDADPRLRRDRRRARTISTRWPPPIASCSWRRAAAGSGLFTAITRLRAVHKRIAPALEAEPASRCSPSMSTRIDTSTLVDIFRAEEDACLLGTDAVRDGVDVPGRSLRLIVFDRVPWPRPDILHKARRSPFRRHGL